MFSLKKTCIISGSLLLALGTGAPLSATVVSFASRTWVSGVGDDANPCSRTAPCKTWAGAISKTQDGGEIDALDAGGFGAVTITKSITLDGGPGLIAGIQASSTNGINVNAAGVQVVLRNLSIEGTSGSQCINGVNVVNAGYVVLDSVSVRYCATGVNVGAGAGNVRVDLKNTDISFVGTGVLVSGPSAVVTLDGATVRGSTTGIAADAGAVFMNDSSLYNNTTGVTRLNGSLQSFGNNRAFGNVTDGAFFGNKGQ